MLDLFTAMLSNNQHAAQEALNAATATAENDTVAVTITGNGQVRAIIIKDELAATPALQDALVDAVNSAILMSQQLARNAQLDAWNFLEMTDDDEEDNDEYDEDTDVDDDDQ